MEAAGGEASSALASAWIEAASAALSQRGVRAELMH